MSTISCDMCAGAIVAEHVVREMMFGSREVFRYGECSQCHSLQLLDVPDDLSNYYPEDYYSFTVHRSPPWKRAAKRARAEAAARGFDRMARLLGRGEAPAWAGYLHAAELDRSASVCDVGCGSGTLLVDMQDQGFTDLCGIDAYISGDSVVRRIPIRKATPNDLTGTYDLIMLNHSFEHMPDPVGTLASLLPRLTPRGAVMVRVPVAGSAVWDRYGTDWSSLDAPRHLYIPSLKGMSVAAQRAGWYVASMLPETSPVQFWRSEQYRQGIPLRDPRAHEVNPAASGFTSDEISRFRRMAREMNARGQAAAAAFILRPASSQRGHSSARPF